MVFSSGLKKNEVKVLLVKKQTCPSGTTVPPSGLAVAIHQRDDEDGDVVAGTQALVADPPASVPQDAAGPHHQVLGRHRVPESAQQHGWILLPVVS